MTLKAMGLWYTMGMEMLGVVIIVFAFVWYINKRDEGRQKLNETLNILIEKNRQIAEEIRKIGGNFEKNTQKKEKKQKNTEIIEEIQVKKDIVTEVPPKTTIPEGYF